MKEKQRHETFGQRVRRQARGLRAEKEAAEILVQKAVEVGQRINDWMVEYVRFNEGRLEAIAGSGQAEVLEREGEKMLRRFNRRVRALERVREIQARAFKKAYGIDPPTIKEIL